MAIQDLTASLDLKQNLNVYVQCKQFDSLNLIFSIFDNSVQADLNNYDVRLKAMKSDQVPLIQEHTGITINSNIVNIDTDEQLTTTAGDTPIELQFIDSTGNKKATFNLVLKVVPSVISVSASISTATYTLLEELENKLDQATDYFESVHEFQQAHPDILSLDNRVTTINSEIETARGEYDNLGKRLDIYNSSTNKINNLSLFNVEDYREDEDIDDTNCIIRAIADCASKNGGTVLLTKTLYTISSPVIIGNGTTTALSTINGIKIRGQSVFSTKIKWNGSVNETMFQINGISKGNSLGDMTLDGNNIAGIGCNIISGQYSQWGDIQIENCKICCLQLTTQTSVPSGQSGNTMGNVFGKLTLKPAQGTSSQQSYGLILTGTNSTVGDSNNNTFPNIHIWAQSNYITATKLAFCDFNNFGVVVCYNAPSLTGTYGLVLDGSIVSNFPSANNFEMCSYSMPTTQIGNPGLNYVNYYGTVDGNIPIPTISGLYGYAQNPNGNQYPVIPFGKWKPSDIQQNVANQLISSTSATNVLNISLATDGLYQINCYIRVVTASTNLTVAIYSGDETGTYYAYLESQKSQQSAVGLTIMNNVSLTVGSYVCVPFIFRYSNEAVQKPILQVTAATANQVYVSASITKVG